MRRIAFVVLLLWSNACLADGMIVPVQAFRDGPPRFDRAIPMPEIRTHRVDARIEGRVAHTRVDQIFYNNHAHTIEGMYIFPLPRGASVSGFSMFVDGTEVIGELLDKDEASAIYERIVRERLDPAILEYVGTNIFKARVFPFEANSEKRVKISYDMVLERSGNTYEYVYPLSTEQFSPVPLEEVVVEVSVRSEAPLSNIFSPTHDVEVSEADEVTYTVAYEESQVTPDIDFQLFFDVPDDDMGFNVLPYKQEGEDGFFIALISPRYKFAEDLAIPRDVVFVIDKSGSMRRGKFEQAREALLYSIRALGEEERFGLVAFSSTVRLFESRLLPATEANVVKAESFLEELEVIGGTDINRGLKEGLDLFESSDALKIMVFLTDGLPTIGVRDVKTILDDANHWNLRNVRIFAFGLGYDVNTYLLDMLSRESRGASEYVRPEERVDYRVKRFFEKLSLPLLADVEVEIGGVKTYDVFPRYFTDVFKNTQMLMAGRYKQGGRLSLSLLGTRSGRDVAYEYATELPGADTERDFVPRHWASQKIGFLLEELRSGGEDEEVLDEIVYLSKRYGVMTPYISFLIREDTPVARAETRSEAKRSPMTTRIGRRSR